MDDVEQNVRRRYPAGGVADKAEIPPTIVLPDCVWVIRLFTFPLFRYKALQETTGGLSWGRIFGGSRSAIYVVS